MYKLIGHLIRMTGLLIEMVGVWGVYTGRDDKHPTLISLPGGNTLPVPWVAVGLGFVLWFIGTLIVYMSRARRNTDKKGQRERDAERFG
jgi:hypothetical protein